MSDKIIIGTSEEGVVSLDVNKLVDSRMLIQGNSGGGKSWLARLLCERAADKVPIIILDPEGEFASLREKIDAILVGPDGDIPTDLRSAPLLARKLVELQISGIIDLYELKPHDRREYVKRFLEALVELPRDLWHPTLVVIDEAHKFAPEKGTGEAVSTQAVINLMSLGRKRGYAGILATQRFSKLHNDTIAETNNVVIGRTWLDADQKRAGEYLGLATADRRRLRELKPGEFYAFGPALSIGGLVKFKSDKVATTHPKAGQRHKIKPPKASDAIQHIIGQIDDLPSEVEKEAKTLTEFQAKAKTREAELQTQIHSLKNQLAKADAPVVIKEDRDVYPVEKLAELEDKIDNYFKPFSLALDNAGRMAEDIQQFIVDLLPKKPEPTTTNGERRIGSYGYEMQKPDPRPINEIVVHKEGLPQGLRHIIGRPTLNTALPRAEPSDPALVIGGDGSALKMGELKVLSAVASVLDGVSLELLTIVTGYKATSRHEYIRQLVNRGYVVKDGNQVAVTVEGLAALGPDFVPLPTKGKPLRDHWLNSLSGGELNLFSVLIDKYPVSVPKGQLQDLTGYKATSVHEYGRKLALRKLITVSNGLYKASDNLF